MQIFTLGRQLPGREDLLVAFEQVPISLEHPHLVSMSRKTQHSIVRFNGRNESRVSGTVFEITDDELADTGRYEPEPYIRVEVRLASGKRAWVYVDGRNTLVARGAEMRAEFKSAWGYQGDNLNLPVKSIDAAIPFYETIMGFRVLSRSDSPHKSAVLGRDDIRIGLAENGGDPTQDGCAFEVNSVKSAFAEFKGNGLEKEISGFDIEQHDDASWKVFYVVAPDGLCYWFGERQTGVVSDNDLGDTR